VTADTPLVEVKSSEPPTITLDPETGAAYLRFQTGEVAYTEEREAEGIILTLDFDSTGTLLGIEALGMASIQIAEILEKAHVRAPNVDYSRVRYMAAAA
jgi:uncharacterized protein YuzE